MSNDVVKPEHVEVAAKVVDMFLADGSDHTVKEIAAALGWAESKTRRALVKDNGFTRDARIGQSRDARTSYSKNYPGMESGAHQVWVYGPTRDALRQMVLAARAEVKS